MKQFAVHSATIVGVDAIPVTVEVAVTRGMPGFAVVGMPDAAVREACERIRAAIRNCGFEVPTQKTVINLAPGFLKKTGSGFDVPIAVAILAATEQIPTDWLEDTLIIGELALDGTARPVRGMLAHLLCAKRMGWNLICPPNDERLGSWSDVAVREVSSLKNFKTRSFMPSEDKIAIRQRSMPDYSEVGGHQIGKRAMQIAATGNHGILLMGPPGSGKTMLASRLPSILPPLTEEQRIETARIHSIAGEDVTEIYAGNRPVRSPHHSATLAGLIGGGNPVRPGEVSLAHNGVLFLDEVSEFSPSVLQALRQPIEQGRIVVTRASGTVEMPARFQLVAASNPCPCGFFGDADVACKCSPVQVNTYQARIGGPLIDRIDMCIDVWRTGFDQVMAGGDELDSATLRKGVMAGRAFAADRWRHAGGKPEKLGTKELLAACAFDDETLAYFKGMSEAYKLSGRGIMRVMGVARTIADIAQSYRVRLPHVAEALTLRLRNATEGAPC